MTTPDPGYCRRCGRTLTPQRTCPKGHPTTPKDTPPRPYA